MNLTIAPVKLKDVHLIPLLIKLSIKEELIPLTIYSSNNYEGYLSNIFRLPIELRNFHYLGAYQYDQLLGFTEWRIQKDGLFLNHISIFPSFRGFGVGKALLEHGFKLAKLYKKNKITLDVFEDNDFADEWYKKNGFKRIASTHWYLSEKIYIGNKEIQKVTVENFHSAEAEHALYDFSNVQIITSRCKYNVGRIKKELFRVTGHQAAEDKELQFGLQELDATRSVLILSEKEIQDNQFLSQGLSNRLSLEIE